jgi:hypothetical protein
MRTTGIGPEAAAMIFTQGSLLQEHAALPVKNEHTKGPMQVAFYMRFHFITGADGTILLIH